MSRFVTHKTYNEQEFLRINKDSDIEDIDRLEPSMHEIDKDNNIEQ